ncbi:hypothetical protein [Mycolicibacterium sp. XJ1819]
MAPNGPPEDPYYPDDAPTQYYGPPGEEPVPWYRRPAALVAFGALGAVIIALIVYGLAKLITGNDAPTEPTTLTPLTTTSRAVLTTTAPPQTVTETVTPTATEPTTTTTTTTTTTEPTTTTTTTTTVEPTTSVSTSTVTETETVTAPPE